MARRAIDALVAAGRRVSLASVAATSKGLDPDGRGIAAASLLQNPEARAYYEQHRTWAKARPGRAGPARPPDSRLHQLKADRDPAPARSRYLKLSKAELVARLLAVEQQYAQERDAWLETATALLVARRELEALRPGHGGGPRAGGPPPATPAHE